MTKANTVSKIPLISRLDVTVRKPYANMAAANQHKFHQPKK